MRYALNTAPINGYQTLYGSGVASIVISVTGYSAKQKTGVSAAAITDIEAIGALKKAKHGSGIARISVDADGKIKKGRPGYGKAVTVSLSGRFGIPDPKLPPSQFYLAHRSRIIYVQYSDLASVVGIENRTVRVQKENRTIYVPHEREI